VNRGEAKKELDKRMSFYIFLSEFFWEIEVLNIFTIPIDGSAVRFLLIEK